MCCIIIVFIQRQCYKRFLKVLHGCCWRICNCFLAFLFLVFFSYFLMLLLYLSFWSCRSLSHLLGGQWSIILGYRRLSVKSLQVLLFVIQSSHNYICFHSNVSLEFLSHGSMLPTVSYQRLQTISSSNIFCQMLFSKNICILGKYVQ